jgi:hypothetical protein
MAKLIGLLALAALFVMSNSLSSAVDAQRGDPSALLAASSPDDRACEVTDIQKRSTIFENTATAPGSDRLAVSQMDANHVHQLYIKSGNEELKCLTCTARYGAPRVDREKMMISFHPLGQWLAVGVEEDHHENAWMPKAWQRGLLQSGVWLNIWITNPAGDRWYQITDFKKTRANPSDGFVGVAFTPDGRKAVWAEIVDGNILAHPFGIWKLYIADFHVSSEGVPSLINKRDITPKGALWVEPGNVSPDGKHVLLSADIGLKDAQEQDQWSLDLQTGAVRNLTDSPQVWDEHGLYSPNGKKITFMSSYPYRNEKKTYKTLSLKTEFMLMDSDGGHLQQLTHFNTPGYPESQRARTIAAVAQFVGDGSQMFGTVMGPDFTKTNWAISFRGRCGG